MTGANKVWVTAGNPVGLPGRFLFPAVTRASELFRAGGTLATAARLRSVIDLPADLGELAPAELALVTRFLAEAEAAGAAASYIACHRKPWWRVRLRAPAPILATYMARRPPAFVRNLAGARHVNIAHGLYPREPLPLAALDGLAAYLRRSVTPGQGRTYAGGLTKFEPGEMERLLVPVPALLPACAPRRPGRTGYRQERGRSRLHTAYTRPADELHVARVCLRGRVDGHLPAGCPVHGDRQAVPVLAMSSRHLRPREAAGDEQRAADGPDTVAAKDGHRRLPHDRWSGEPAEA